MEMVELILLYIAIVLGVGFLVIGIKLAKIIALLSDIHRALGKWEMREIKKAELL